MIQVVIKCALLDVIRFLYWYPFRKFVQLLPFSFVRILGQIGGFMLSRVSKKKRLALEYEISLIYGKNMNKVNKDKFNKSILNSFTILCQNALEVLIYPKLNSNNIDFIIKYYGFNNLDKSLRKGNGVMLLFAHFGANQMIMPAIGYKGYKMSQLSAPSTVWKEKMPNKTFSRMAESALEIRWIQELSLPVKHINIFGSLKDAFLCLKRNEILGIAIDGGGGKDRVVIDFLGKKALFSVGAIEIAMRTGCTVLPVFMVRSKNGKNMMIIEPALKVLTKDEDPNAVKKNISAFVKRLERYVLKYPCHYLNYLVLRRLMIEQGDMAFIMEETEK